MLFGQIERELLNGEIYSSWETHQLPGNLQLLIDQDQVKQDIWECQSQKAVTLVSSSTESLSHQKGKLFHHIFNFF